MMKEFGQEGEGLSDEILQTIWEEYQMYYYDPCEEVDNWRAEWGSLLQRSLAGSVEETFIPEDTSAPYCNQIRVEHRKSIDWVH